MEYADYYQDALSEPMKWFPLDTDFMNDPKVLKLSAMGGWQAVGRYVALIACLARADGRRYDLSEPMGWRFLSAAMVCGGEVMDTEELHEFITTLYDLRLIDREMWDESRKVSMPRLCREAENMARKTAANMVRTAKATAARSK